MLIQILTHTPLYVWALLGALVALGLAQTRSRRVAPSQLLILPAVLLGLGLWSTAGAALALPAVGLAWAVALAAGVTGGLRLPPPAGAAWLPEAGRLQLPGSWMPLLLTLKIFSLRYAMAVGSALHPEWRTELARQLPAALVFGALAGLSLGRSLGLMRLAAPVPAGATIAAHAR